MKMFRLDILKIFLGLVLLALGIVLPSFLIQSIWNASFSSSIIDRDLSIEVWQAALLWGSLLSLLWMTGIFKFKIGIKTIDSVDLKDIEDPELRRKVEELKSFYSETQEAEASKEESKSADDSDSAL